MYCGSQDLFGDIAKDIAEMESMLKRYGVEPIRKERLKIELKENSVGEKYIYELMGFDFTEHDREFKAEIELLKSKVHKLECELKEKEEELERYKKNGCKIVVVAKEINGVEYVPLEDFIGIVNDLTN